MAEMNESEVCDVDVFDNFGLSSAQGKSEMDGQELRQIIAIGVGIILVPVITWLLIKLSRGKVTFLFGHRCIGNGDVNCRHGCKLNVKRVCKNLEERIDKIEASMEPINKNLGILLEKIASIENSVKAAVDEVIANKRKIIVTEVMENLTERVCREVTLKQTARDIKINEPKGNLKTLLHQILNLEEARRKQLQNRHNTNRSLNSHKKEEKPILCTISIKRLKQALNKIRSQSESMQNIYERHAENRPLNRSPSLFQHPVVPSFRPSLIINCKPFPVTYNQN
ncbi:uncharacterized protein LOC106665723 isoform X2 [Cimex lectularius]|uniref:Transmembrane protein n=1 Tax=Cimex lectularius TaxID=79782 RepID=A0A8I6RK57_CIMLE|nr:uncharacterized protein LOC106665723 isoform X2 [Cimex lectularius]